MRFHRIQRIGQYVFYTIVFLMLCVQINEAQGPRPEPLPTTNTYVEPIRRTTPSLPTALQTPTPATVVVQTGTTTPAKPPLAHTSPVKPEPLEQLNAANAKPTGSPTPEDPLLKKAKDDAVMAYYSAVKQSNEAILVEYEHNKWALKNREIVLEWQQWAGKIIFGVVLILVLVGVVFSGIQFFIGLKHAKKSRRTESADITTIEASWQGIKMTSSVLGVIILIVSFLFFYMYLVIVFPVTVVSE